VVCGFVERLANLWLKISDARKQLTSLEDRLDLLNVQIGEVELDSALADFKI